MHPIKRPRVDSQSEPAEPVCSDIWFEDGNIVIRAENTQFRVYKGTLCSHSDVLKQAIENMEESKGVDGCPLLRLSDCSTDVQCVLRTIFYRWAYPDNDPLPFNVISAFLRLGKKYRIQPLYDNGLLRLKSAFPPTRDEYSQNRSRERISFGGPGAPGSKSTIAVDTILLARELDIPSLLPAAFWLAATQLELLAAPNTSSLSEADRTLLISSAKPLRVAHANYLFGWLDDVNSDCIQRVMCDKKKTMNALTLWKPPGLSPFFSWAPSLAKGLCNSCAAAGRDYHSTGSQRLWDELPSFFGLPPWAELLAAAPNEQGA
ncbi:hypothetical protein FB451DRAFT_1097548 [Mycena latifolia]|nr:hypothetical protein FB451DRAFT_1097548 [Mycena latifolia]